MGANLFKDPLRQTIIIDPVREKVTWVGSEITGHRNNTVKRITVVIRIPRCSPATRTTDSVQVSALVAATAPLSPV